jgi:hypothetical protein
MREAVEPVILGPSPRAWGSRLMTWDDARRYLPATFGWKRPPLLTHPYHSPAEPTGTHQRPTDFSHPAYTGSRCCGRPGTRWGRGHPPCTGSSVSCERYQVEPHENCLHQYLASALRERGGVAFGEIPDRPAFAGMARTPAALHSYPDSEPEGLTLLHARTECPVFLPLPRAVPAVSYELGGGKSSKRRGRGEGAQPVTSRSVPADRH